MFDIFFRFAHRNLFDRNDVVPKRFKRLCEAGSKSGVGNTARNRPACKRKLHRVLQSPAIRIPQRGIGVNDGFKFFIVASKNTIQIVKPLLRIVVDGGLIDEIAPFGEDDYRIVVERFFLIQNGALQLLLLRIGSDGERVVEKKQGETQNERQKQKRSCKTEKRDS